MSLVVLGKYRIERAIGGGVTGSVYRARVVGTEAAVAVKEVRRDLGWIPVIGSSCRLALQAARDVRHPSLGALHAIAEEQGRTLIVTDWVDGEGLSEVVEWSEGKLPLPKATALMVQLLTALHEAHKGGLIHGNLKPENVLIPRGGGVQRASVVDFGVAPVLGDTGVGRMGEGLVPNLGFRAPEQIRDPSALAPSIDIYSVGALLYQLLTGRQPFPHSDPAGVIQGHLRDIPKPVRDLNPQVPEGLAQIVARALAKDPGQRFASVLQMCEAIAEFAPAAPVRRAAPAASRKARRSDGAAARSVSGAVAAAVGGAVATTAARRRSDASTVPRQAALAVAAAAPARDYDEDGDGSDAPTAQVAIADVLGDPDVPPVQGVEFPEAGFDGGPRGTLREPQPAMPSGPRGTMREPQPETPPGPRGTMREPQPAMPPTAARAGSRGPQPARPDVYATAAAAAPPPDMVAVSPLAGQALADEPVPVSEAPSHRPASAVPHAAPAPSIARLGERAASPAAPKKSSKIWLILLVVVLLLAVAAAAVYLLVLKKKDGGASATSNSEPAASVAAGAASDEAPGEASDEAAPEGRAADDEGRDEPEEKPAPASGAVTEDDEAPDSPAPADGGSEGEHASASAAREEAAPEPAVVAAPAPAPAPAPDDEVAAEGGEGGEVADEATELGQGEATGEAAPADLAAGGFPRAAVRDVSGADQRKAEKLNAKGYKFYQKGRNAEALEQYLEAIKVDPNPARYWYNAACLHALRGDASAAITYLEGWASRMLPDQIADVRSKLDADGDFETVREHPRFRSFRAKFD